MIRPLILIAALALQLAAQEVPAQSPRTTEPDEIRALIGRGTLQPLRRPNFASFRPALEDLYREADFAPRWFGGGSSTRVLLAALAAAPTHGLDAADYDADWLAAETSAIETGDRSPARIARADVALTVSLFRLLSDLHRGRVSPKQAGFSFSADKPLDFAAFARRGLQTGAWNDVVSAAEPSFPLYKRLEDALARYRTLAAMSLPPLPPLPAGKRKIEVRELYPGVAALTERLRLLGDLPANAAAPDGDRYEGALVDAVRSFQDRHGLEADGMLGAATLAELATPLNVRVRQIELSLERLRWLPELPAGPLIAVNIPSFRLWAFANARDDAAAQLTMPVIVGNAAKARETPVFIGEMRWVEFSPYWNVTPAIQRGEVVPKLERDPGYWEREEFEALPVGGGAPITVLDAKTLEGLKSGALRVRQRPGPKNALGGVKFVLPNTMNIYLHSTPAQRLFSEMRRDFSHGCIRVADPPALAAFVLRDQPLWTPERIREAMAAGTMSTAPLTRPLPVVLFYTTAIVDAKGSVRFTSDIYGHDRKLEQALRAR